VANVFGKSSSGLLSAGLLTLLVGGTLGLSSLALAQSAPAADAATDDKVSDVQLLRDFIHYIRIDRNDVANAVGEDLLRRIKTPVDFVNVVESSDELPRFLEAVSRGQRRAELENISAALSKLYEAGKLARARDPEEIKKNIALLTTTVLGESLGRERLVTAGEYAVPQLLNALLDNTNPSLRARVRSVLQQLGRHSVMPLATALPNLTPDQQESVVDVLGGLDRRAALPFIADLKGAAATPGVTAACDRAIQRLGGLGTAEDTADLYYQLAEGYAQENADLTPFPGEEFQLLWSYTASQGLVPAAIRTPVFHEAMAMRAAERSLSLKPSDRLALTTWIASNFNREIQTPEGYTNPAYGPDKRDAMYFAVASGPQISQGVLARAITDRNTPLARKAIAAIERTAGGSSLWGAETAASPLLQALIYPNRRVQYESALALAAAQPKTTFAGSDRVVPTLAGAIREASESYAAIVATDEETYQSLRAALEGAGYKVLPRGSSLGELQSPISEVPAVDLVIVANMNADRIVGVIDEVRGTPKLVATPVLGLADSEDTRTLAVRYERDESVAFRQAGVSESQLTTTIVNLMKVTSGGPITPEEAVGYSARALAALRDLAVSGNPVLNVSDAAGSLISSLGTTTGDIRLSVAEVLSRIDQQRSQVSLMDAALEAESSEQVALLEKVAGSAKRFGNRLEPRQVARLLTLTRTAAGETATAAAALMGALNLPNDDLMPLILGTGKGAEAKASDAQITASR
jgi:HEAT repeat protein